jgi:hypothetical protein
MAIILHPHGSELEYGYSHVALQQLVSLRQLISIYWSICQRSIEPFLSTQVIFDLISLSSYRLSILLLLASEGILPTFFRFIGLSFVPWFEDIDSSGFSPCWMQMFRHCSSSLWIVLWALNYPVLLSAKLLELCVNLIPFCQVHYIILRLGSSLIAKK